MIVNSMDKCFTNKGKGYISKALAYILLEHGVTIVNDYRKNMKNKNLSLLDRATLSRRIIIDNNQ